MGGTYVFLCMGTLLLSLAAKFFIGRYKFHRTTEGGVVEYPSYGLSVLVVFLERVVALVLGASIIALFFLLVFPHVLSQNVATYSSQAASFAQ